MSTRRMDLPPEVEEVFREFRTCEFSTLARDGTPIVWPTLPFWYPDEGRFLITTSIGLPHKALNARRDPRVRPRLRNGRVLCWRRQSCSWSGSS